MIRNCVIYRYSEESASIRDVNKSRFSDVTLSDCLTTVSGQVKKRVEAYINLVRAEKLSLEDETQLHYTAKYSCEFQPPKLIAAGSPSPFVPVSFEIWIRKANPLVIVFDAGRRLSGCAVALLSYITTGSSSSIEQIRLEKEDFLKLKDSILVDSNLGKGEIRHISMRDVEVDKIKFKQIVLNASRLEESRIFNQFLSSASAIAYLSFITPPLVSTSRPLTCRINYWGSLTIYTPGLLDSEIEELIGMLEDRIPAKTRVKA